MYLWKILFILSQNETEIKFFILFLKQIPISKSFWINIFLYRKRETTMNFPSCSSSNPTSLVHSLIYMIAVIGCTIVSDPFTKKTTDISTLTIFSPSEWPFTARAPLTVRKRSKKEKKERKKRAKHDAEMTRGDKWSSFVGDKILYK